jgi:two-component system phosphate regulon response regulator PhoB
LIERRGRTQSRETLLHDVWGYQNPIDTRTVDTHIRRLREKLGKHAIRLETVRGEGYLFRTLDP